MNVSNMKLLWSFSLIIISVVTIVLTVCNFNGIVLPDSIKRIMGLIDICAIPVLVYTSIKTIKKDK